MCEEVNEYVFQCACTCVQVKVCAYANVCVYMDILVCTFTVRMCKYIY